MAELRRKEVATYNPEDGLPDGLALDSEGRIWTAFAKGGAVICLDPQTGNELGRIKLPIKMPTACTFGGSTLGELYITTADLGGGRGAGGLWRFRLDGLKGQAGAHFTKRGT